MSLVGRNDRLCPIEGVEHLDEGLSEAYEAAGKSDHWQPVIASGGHMETMEMRMTWQQFLKKHL
jgi:hypothetical protein